MSKLSSTTAQKVSATTKSKEAGGVSRNEFEDLHFHYDSTTKMYVEQQKQIDQLELINKELTGLVFRLANNIYQLQIQIDDVKKNIEGSSDADITQVVGEVK